MTVDIFTTPEKYGIVYTEPPWPQKKGGARKCRPNQGRALDYQTESLAEIKRIHREALEHTEDHHDVFMWTIDKFLIEAEAMMKELGYELHARIIWDKGNGVAPAFTVRYTHEYLQGGAIRQKAERGMGLLGQRGPHRPRRGGDLA